MSAVELYKDSLKTRRLEGASWISRISPYAGENEVPDLLSDKVKVNPNVLKQQEAEGENLYIVRVQVESDLILGKFFPPLNTVYISYDKRDHFLLVSEMLVARPRSLAWVPSSGGQLVPNAVIGGRSSINGQPVFIGRAKCENKWVAGKVVPGRGRCFISCGSSPKEFENYEILVGVDDGSGKTPRLPDKAKWAYVDVNQPDDMIYK